MMSALHPSISGCKLTHSARFKTDIAGFNGALRVKNQLVAANLNKNKNKQIMPTVDKRCGADQKSAVEDILFTVIEVSKKVYCS